MAVSRPHARISFAQGQHGIEDLNSHRGTTVDEKEIRGCGPFRFGPNSVVQVGETVLFFETVPVSDATISPILIPKEPPLLAAADPGATATPLANALDVPFEPAETAASRQQRLLYGLLLQFGSDAPLDRMLQFAIEQLVAAMPVAERGALLLKDSSGAAPLLKAFCPPGEPAVSTTLVEHALNCGGGFIWQRGKDSGSESADHIEMASGIYSPLVWRGETYGVICVDNCHNSREFTDHDLELVVAAAQHIALAIANLRMRDDLRRNAALVERLLTNFSPAVRRRLLEKARVGRLRLGGEKSEVTILSSDIRGFTNTTATMDADDVVDLLNSYFSALVSAIFKHDGTVDKFIGDAVLAVFGSPEPDPDHHVKAVRAAWAMQAAIQEVNDARRASGKVVCEMGIGVHCGEVLHGFIGSEERMEFTVIGDTVNWAARYCSGAGPSEVLISPELYQRVWNFVVASKTVIHTKHEGDQPAYRLTAMKAATANSVTRTTSLPADKIVTPTEK